MTRRLGGGASLAALLAAALTVVSAPTSSAADPMFQAPVVGQCNDMSAEELAAPSDVEAAVDCAGPHTSMTIAVVQMPADLTYESRGLERFALESCFPAQRKVLGTKMLGMRLTAYNLGYFGPTPEQQAAGARWLRCDLVLGDASAPQPLPAKLEVGKTRKFPSEKAWKRIGTQRCRNAVTSRVYRFGWPSKVAWKAGDHTLLCYSKTRR